MNAPRKLIGKWWIAETELWETDALDSIVPAHITFDADGLGHFQMIAIEGGLDCRYEGDRVEISWIGDDDGESINGRGWQRSVRTASCAGAYSSTKETTRRSWRRRRSSSSPWYHGQALVNSRPRIEAHVARSAKSAPTTLGP
jgi:hypothetical protein